MPTAIGKFQKEYLSGRKKVTIIKKEKGKEKSRRSYRSGGGGKNPEPKPLQNQSPEPVQEKQVSTDLSLQNNAQSIQQAQDYSRYQLRPRDQYDSTGNNRARLMADQVSVRAAFPSSTSTIPQSRQVTLEKPKGFVKRSKVETETKFLGVTVKKRSKKVVSYDNKNTLKTDIKKSGGSTGSVNIVSDKTLNRPKTLGITEPSFKGSRALEYELDKRSGTAEIDLIRKKSKDGRKRGVDFLQPEFSRSTSASFQAAPLKAVNRPVKTSVDVALLSIGLSKSTGAGKLISTNQALGGALIGSTAVGVSQSSKKGESGAQVLGENLFYGSVVVGANALSKARASSNIEFDLSASNKGVTGVSRKGGVIEGQKVDSAAFYSRGKVTKTFLNQGKTKTVIESRPSGQYIKQYKKGKLVGENFNYPKQSQPNLRSTKPQLESREIGLFDQRIEKPASRIVFRESYTSNVKGGNRGVEVNLKVGDVMNRKVVVTDEVVKTRTFVDGVETSRGFQRNKPVIEFDKRMNFLKDSIDVKTSKTGDQFTITKKVAPKIIEPESSIQRTGSGTLKLDKPSLLTQLKQSKRGSLQRGKVETLAKNDISVSIPKSNIPKFTTFETVPSFEVLPKSSLGFFNSFNSSSSGSTQINKVDNIQRNDIKVRSRQLSSPIQETSFLSRQKPIQDVNTFQSSNIIQNQRTNQKLSQKLSQKQKTQQTTQTLFTRSVPLSLNFSTSIGVGVSTPTPPVLPVLPSFNLGSSTPNRSSKKKKKGKPKKKNLPTASSVLFGLSGKTPSFSYKSGLGQRYL